MRSDVEHAPRFTAMKRNAVGYCRTMAVMPPASAAASPAGTGTRKFSLDR
jgi:hypothetical protein